MIDLFGVGAGGGAAALLQVVFIDLVLAGDNAVAVGLAAAGLAEAQRKKAILYGLIAAVGIRVAFALVAAKLLAIIGLMLAGGLLLLWVCWKMWGELTERAPAQEETAGAALEGEAGADAPPGHPAKSFKAAFVQILIADVSMSLDNVMAVAGAAREHPAVLVIGLLLSIGLMGVAATTIAKLLHRHRWIGFVGLAIVLWVALSMIWEGHRQVVTGVGQEGVYNAMVPDFMDITPEEENKAHAAP